MSDEIHSIFHFLLDNNFYNEFNTPTLQDKHVDGFHSLFCFKMLKEIWEGENMMKWLKMV